MADNPTVVATPYPTYMSGGNDDDSFRAALISHSGASVERNQDAGFDSLRQQLTNRDVKDASRETAQAKYDLAVQTKDAEIRASDRFNEISKELAALRAETQANTIAQLRVELSESRADGRQQKTESLLSAILAKLPV
jgi:hypothetical protein